MAEIELYPYYTAPVNRDVLLYWERYDCFEKGTVLTREDTFGERYHVLFDGEQMHVEPSHWGELPTFNFKPSPD